MISYPKLVSMIGAGLLMLANAVPAFAGGIPTPTVAQCQVNGEGSPRPLDVADGGIKYGQFNNLALLSRLKTRGGVCQLKFDQTVTFSLDSGTGEIKLNGTVRPNGKTVLTGNDLVITYGSGDSSAGFVVVVEVPEGAPAPIQQVQTQAVAPAPAQVVAAPPPSAPSKELSGSCTIGGVQYNMKVDTNHPKGWLLYMDEHMLAAGKKAGEVPCRYNTPYDAVVQIAPANKDVKAGFEEYVTVKGGDSFGFAVQTSHKESAPQATPTVSSTGGVNIGEGSSYDGSELKGSCTIAGVVHTMSFDPWHPAGWRLYMRPTMLLSGQATAGEIPCHFATPRNATVEIGDPRPEASAGRQYFFNVQGGAGFGFAVQTHR